jgi:hypothetical protein
MLMTFWDGRGILLLQFLDHRATVKVDHYWATLQHLKEVNTWVLIPSLLETNRLFIAGTS